MEPVPATDPCCFPGPAATRCPGYRPAAVAASVPEHLRFLPIFSISGAQNPGCAHLVAVRTARGGFRAGCGHPAGSPAHWGEDETLVGQPVPRVLPRRVLAR